VGKGDTVHQTITTWKRPLRRPIRSLSKKGGRGEKKEGREILGGGKKEVKAEHGTPPKGAAGAWMYSKTLPEREREKQQNPNVEKRKSCAFGSFKSP